MFDAGSGRNGTEDEHDTCAVTIRRNENLAMAHQAEGSYSIPAAMVGGCEEHEME